MTFQTIKLQGTEQDYGGTVLTSTIAADGGYTLESIEVVSIFAIPKIEFTQNLDGSAEVNKQYTFELEIILKQLPTSNTNSDSFFNLDCLNKNFLYLDISNYTLRPFNVAANYSIRLLKNEYTISVESEKNYKRIKIGLTTDV